MRDSKGARAGGTRQVRGIRVEVGSGNVFEDLGLPSPKLRLAKARLAAQINTIIEDYDWTQAEAAKKLRTHQPTISLLEKGRLAGISYERLLGWLFALNQDVQILVSPAKRTEPKIEVLAVR